MQMTKAISFTLTAAMLVGNTCARAESKAAGEEYKTLDVVTLAEPTARQHCHVISTNDESTECKLAFGKTKIYQRSEMVALIAPPEDADKGWKLLKGIGWTGLTATAQGMAIYGAVVLGSAIPTVGLSVVALVLAPAVIWALSQLGEGMFDSEPSHDKVIYQRSDTSLQVQLR